MEKASVSKLKDNLSAYLRKVRAGHPVVAHSLQLAAALVAADHNPASLELVCLDTRLSSAAQREGFSVIER